MDKSEKIIIYFFIWSDFLIIIETSFHMIRDILHKHAKKIYRKISVQSDETS